MFKDQRVHILQKQNNHNQCISKLQRERRGGGIGSQKKLAKGVRAPVSEREREGGRHRKQKKKWEKGSEPQFHIFKFKLDVH